MSLDVGSVWRRMTLGLLIAMGGCAAPKPAATQPAEDPKVVLLRDVETRLVETEGLLNDHQYEKAVQSANELWTRIPPPNQVPGKLTPKETWLLSVAAWRSAEIPIDVSIKQGNFTEATNNLEACRQRCERSLEYESGILPLVVDVVLDPASRDQLSKLPRVRYANDPLSPEYRKWSVRLTTTAKEVEILAASGRKSSAMETWRNLEQSIGTEIRDAGLRECMMRRWKRIAEQIRLDGGAQDVSPAA